MSNSLPTRLAISSVQLTLSSTSGATLLRIIFTRPTSSLMRIHKIIANQFQAFPLHITTHFSGNSPLCPRTIQLFFEAALYIDHDPQIIKQELLCLHMLIDELFRHEGKPHVCHYLFQVISCNGLRLRPCPGNHSRIHLFLTFYSEAVISKQLRQMIHRKVLETVHFGHIIEGRKCLGFRRHFQRLQSHSLRALPCVEARVGTDILRNVTTQFLNDAGALKPRGRFQNVHQIRTLHTTFV
mmetsp:Transcript_44350/g.82373  ORF Transcript_44350/g.82373 Transcript_44350/m.82373 type:complete len:240 (-) Transcript_44350:512-1231(-)